MSTEIGWNHPIDHADQWDGFNESGMHHFTGNPIRHLAREVIQNALDAHKNDCVIVKIKLNDIPVSTIPHLDELKNNIDLCYQASKAEGKKAENFFEKAKAELNKTKIQVLEISDYNTTGIKGPSENGTPYYAFMKAKGQSKKVSETATGSYGIGKFAPYTVSKIRTIFVSTIYETDTKDLVQLTQGKSILMSHDDGDKRRQGTGFWGVKEKCQPVTGSLESVPNWIVRATGNENLKPLIGSKLSILCFENQKNWQEILVVSIIENFFAAILDGKVKVDIDDGKYILEKNTISEYYSENNVKKFEPLIKDQKNEPEQFIHSKFYLTAYQNGVEVIKEESQTKNLGLCELRIWVSEGLPKKVCAIRNGMFITDNLKGLKQFSDFKEFVAVFTCHSKDGNELLRSMEPPRHDDFEIDLLPRDEQIKGQKALKEISEWVRDCLKRHAKDPVSDITEIDELKDFFGDEGESDTGKGTQEINPYGEIVIRGKPIKSKLNSSSNTIEDPNDIGDENLNGQGGGGDNGTGGGNSSSGGSGSTQNGGGGSTSGDRNMIEISNIRAPASVGKQRKISFTPMKTGQIKIQIKEAGADVDYDVVITNASSGNLQKDGLVLDVVSGVRTSVEIELAQIFSGAIKVVAYEV